MLIKIEIILLIKNAVGDIMYYIWLCADLGGVGLLNLVIAKNEFSKDIFPNLLNLEGHNVKTINSFSKSPFKNLYDIDFVFSDIESLLADDARLLSQITDRGLNTRLIVVGNEKRHFKLTNIMCLGIKCFEPDLKKAKNRILEILENRVKEKEREREVVMMIHDGTLAKKVKLTLEKGDSRLLNKNFLFGHKFLPLELSIVKEYYSSIMKAVYEFAEEKGVRHLEKKDLYFEIAKLTDIESVCECSVKKITSVIHLVEVNNKKHNRMVAEYIKDYVDENYMKQDTNAGNIAERFRVSSSYIGALFKEQEKTTITKYITQLRINKAAELLTETKLQIQTISKKVGYSDQNYFARIFKKQTGLSPGEYRNKSSH